MRVSAIDVVHVGSAARDLTDADRRGWRLGGGASYSALTTARLGLRTAAVIGVDSHAATATELELLRDAGAELLLVPLEEGPVFRNDETPTGRVQAWPIRGHALPVPDLSAAWRRTRAWSLVPVASELGEPWANLVRPEAFTSLAWQGLLREQGPDRLTVRRRPGPSALVDVADLVGVSRHDLAPGMSIPALVALLRPGTQLAVTDGHDGGRLIRVGPSGRSRTQRWAAIEPAALTDPTGAGDVFLAALAASNARPDLTARPGRGRSMAAHHELAAAAASFVVEAPGLHGVPTRAAVLARLAARA
jgi:sugar/nucleoside kinase (ribokinase family)